MKKLPLGTEEKTKLRKSLKKIHFLADLRWIDVDALASRTTLYAHPEGVTIFKQGAVPDALYLIHDGAVEVKYKKGLFAGSKVLKELGAGDFFGEMALVDGSRRTASVKTLVPTKLFVLRSEVIDAMLVENEAFRNHIKAVAESRKFLNSQPT